MTFDAKTTRKLDSGSMPTLVLPFRHKPDFTLLWQTAIEQKWKTERWPLRPPFPKLDGEIVLYCDPLTSVLLTEATGLQFDEVPLDWLTRVPEQYLRRTVRFGHLSDLEAMTQGWPGPWFIKPARDKVFAAAIYNKIADVLSQSLRDDTPILVSGPITFSQEWRFFIGHRKVEAFSIYARNGEGFRDRDKWSWEESEEEQARLFVEGILNDQDIPFLDSHVIDVGLTSQGWAVVESNDAYASGLYACEPEGVLRALRASSRQVSP
jgi:hypothetical protein